MSQKKKSLEAEKQTGKCLLILRESLRWGIMINLFSECIYVAVIYHTFMFKASNSNVQMAIQQRVTNVVQKIE